MSDAAGTPGANPEQEHVNSWPVDELEPHSKNVEIYREKSLSRDFVESIKKRGVEVPLLVTKQGIVIDGSRRLRAAREIGLVEVPVVERAFDSELDEREAVVHLNKNRVKTFLQRMREAEELFRIEKARAKHPRVLNQARSSQPANMDALATKWPTKWRLVPVRRFEKR